MAMPPVSSRDRLGAWALGRLCLGGCERRIVTLTIAQGKPYMLLTTLIAAKDRGPGRQCRPFAA